MRRLVAVVTLSTFLGAGCARQASWPAGAASVADEGFVAQARPVGTVDLLPVDLQVWTEAGVPETAYELRDRAASSVVSASLGTLTTRAYGVQAVIDRQGDAGSGPVLAPDELEGTLRALAGFSAAVRAEAPAMPVPRLPVRLGQATGSDATLYVGGWAYVARPRASRGEKVAKGVAIGLVAVALVGVVVAIAAGSKGKGSSDRGSGRSSGDGESGGGDGGKGGGGGEPVRPPPRSGDGGATRVGGSSMRDVRNPIDEVADQRAAFAYTMGHRNGMSAPGAVRAARSGSSASTIRDHRGGGAGAPPGGAGSGGGAVRDHRDGGSTTAGSGAVRDHRDGSGGSRVRDHRDGDGAVRDHRRSHAPRSSLDLALDLGADVTLEAPPEPDPGAAPDADPREALKGKHSVLYLEMTLVDNRTGLVLWHAHQTFPASAARRGEVERATRLMLASLPSAVAPSPAR